MTNNRTYENPQVLDLGEVVRELANLGLSVDTIARTTRQDRGVIQSMIVQSTVSEAVEEKRLEDDFRRLMQASIHEAFKVLQFGHSEAKLQVVRAMLTNTGRAVGKDAKSPNDDIRTSFQKLVAEMTEVDAPQTQALASPVDDSYEATGREEARPRLRRSY